MSVTLEEAKANPDLYQIDDSGIILLRETGKMVGNPGGGKYGITSTERSLELHRRRKEQGIISKLRGLALAAEIELPDDLTDEQLVGQAGNVLELLTAHMAKTFLGSKNLRGMAESYGRLAEPFAAGPESAREGNTLNPLEQIGALALEYIKAKHQERGDIVEGSVSPEAAKAALLKPS